MPSCPVCKKEVATLYRTGVRENPDTPVFECGYCGLRYIEPPFKDLREYYLAEYREAHSAVPGGSQSVNERYQFQSWAAGSAARSIKEFVPLGGSLLDIGCSAGGLLSRLEGSYELYGAEWNEEDAAFVREAGVPVDTGDLSEIFPGKKFTAISAMHVLEHQADPVEFIRQIKGKLIGGGYLYLETPNIEDALLTQYDIPEYETFWYREPHITYWNAYNLASMLSYLGFEARVDWIQRYSFANHTHWLSKREPMKDPYVARGGFQPVPVERRSAAALNRVWKKMDHEYRVQIRTLYACDTITVKARVREI
jgi:2-polyprenyl-3-methyl-5-hydroxy-6-metoxy-1,4-benzoquinol methylase